MKSRGVCSLLWSPKFLLQIFLVVCSIFAVSTPKEAYASSERAFPRIDVSQETRTEYEWWLLNWSNNNLVCSLRIDHQGWPYETEILRVCGQQVHERWIKYPYCPTAESGGGNCPGLYLMFYKEYQVQHDVVSLLPPAAISISLPGCTLADSSYLCSQLPRLRIHATEPAVGQQINQVGVHLEGVDMFFPGEVAELELTPTDSNGKTISFWADSSLGDSLSPTEARYRVLRHPELDMWQVDVLSTNLIDGSSTNYALLWMAFPSQANWLTSATHPDEIVTAEPYLYLAGQLIRWGAVDASTCADGGLLRTGYASQCGLESSHLEVVAWQNNFNTKIVEVSQQTGVPAQLIKNLIAQETQFWPGHYELAPDEYGIGRLTESGADTVLLWHRDFYQQICNSLFIASECVRGYAKQSPTNQQMLRGAVINYVDASCASCLYQIDLNKTETGIEVVGYSLLAKAAQVNQIFANLTGKPGGEVSSYEDLWRFVLVDYNVGPGCLYSAFQAVLNANATLNWQNVSNNLTGDCRNANEYVERITRDRWGMSVGVSFDP
ncbi:MAG: hypothetical protein KIS80_05105 [Anaerolineales bacterium]|nr:hypothetical protein [Anaerolineales bacterium]